MAIDIEEFESGPESLLELDRETNGFKALSFLAENPEKAFTPGEISDETGIKRGSIGTVLGRLEENGLVRHRGKYWAIAEDDRIASFTAMIKGSSSSVNDGEDN